MIEGNNGVKAQSQDARLNIIRRGRKAATSAEAAQSQPMMAAAIEASRRKAQIEKIKKNEALRQAGNQIQEMKNYLEEKKREGEISQFNQDQIISKIERMLVNNPKINVMEEVRKLIKKLEDGRRKRVEYRRRDNQGAKPMIIDRKIEGPEGFRDAVVYTGGRGGVSSVTAGGGKLRTKKRRNRKQKKSIIRRFNSNRI